MNGETYTKLCEGLTLTAKPDAKGAWEFGYGFDFYHHVPVKAGDTITRDEADAYFPTPYAVAERWAMLAVGPTWHGLDDVRQCALIDMAYELGGTGLAEFRHMLLAVTQGAWDAAADACRDSRYARQVPERAARSEYMLRTSKWPQGFGG